MAAGPGVGAVTFRKLAKAGVNVELLLPVRISSEQFFVVFCVDDVEAANDARDKLTSNDATSGMPGGYHPNFVHCPSETTSTEPSTTLMAVRSSMA